MRRADIDDHHTRHQLRLRAQRWQRRAVACRRPGAIRQIEIGEHFGIRSTNGVNDHLKALERKGYLLRGELKSRALSVIEGGKPARFARREVEHAPEANSGRVVDVRDGVVYVNAAAADGMKKGLGTIGMA